MRKTKDEIKLKELCEERALLLKKMYGRDRRKNEQRMKVVKNEIKNCQRRLNLAPERMVLIEKKQRKKT